MKKKLLLALVVATMLTCLFAIGISAATITTVDNQVIEITTYNDAPSRTNITVSIDDVIVFDDGFACPSAYVFMNSAKISAGSAGAISSSVDFTYINGKRQAETGNTEFAYKFANVLEVDIPQGITYVGDRAFQGIATIKRISFPDTVTGFGVAMCQNATALEECTFEHTKDSNLKSFASISFIIALP